MPRATARGGPFTRLYEAQFAAPTEEQGDAEGPRVLQPSAAALAREAIDAELEVTDAID